MVKPVVKLAGLIGFVLIIFSKEKVEDEFIMTVRLRAAAISFFTVIISVVIQLMLQLFTNEIVLSTDAILMQQCIFYLISFQVQKTGILTYKQK